MKRVSMWNSTGLCTWDMGYFSNWKLPTGFIWGNLPSYTNQPVLTNHVV